MALPLVTATAPATITDLEPVFTLCPTIKSLFTPIRVKENSSCHRQKILTELRFSIQWVKGFCTIQKPAISLNRLTYLITVKAFT